MNFKLYCSPFLRNLGAHTPRTSQMILATLKKEDEFDKDEILSNIKAFQEEARERNKLLK